MTNLVIKCATCDKSEPFNGDVPKHWHVYKKTEISYKIKRPIFYCETCALLHEIIK